MEVVTYGQTDGQTDLTKLIVYFQNSAKAAKTKIFSYLKFRHSIVLS
jgi:hypothetical protein